MVTWNPFDFTGKTVVLTGAAGALGRPICVAFAEAGANVYAIDASQAALQELRDEAKRVGTEVVTSCANLCVQEEVDGVMRSVRERFGAIDVLVNLVGGIIRKPSVEYRLEDWEHVLDINLKACWLSCQAVGKLMIGQGHGRIINFSSNAALHGIKGYPAYGPAKAGIIALTRVLAVEWGPYGVATNVIAPGFTDTPMNDEVLKDRQAVEGILRRLPFNQILPGDAMVGPTLFLASDAARWINGHTLHVDSGFNVT